jgi:hypothetical protein
MIDKTAFLTKVTSPPNPWLLEPYRNALKLGQFRKYVASRNSYSYPWWAQVLRGWDCEKSQDRLNALYGIAFCDDKTSDQEVGWWYHGHQGHDAHCQAQEGPGDCPQGLNRPMSFAVVQSGC